MDSTSASTIQLDVVCAQCEYNLRGLPSDSRCPECGMDIAESLRAHPSGSFDPAWLRRVRSGVARLLIVLIISLLAGYFIDGSRLFFGTVYLWVGLVSVPPGIALVLGFMGFWVIGNRDPIANRFAVSRRILRAALAISGVVFLGTLLFFWLAEHDHVTRHLTWRYFNALWLTMNLCSAPIAWAGLHLLSRVMSRLNRRELAFELAALSVLMPATIILGHYAMGRAIHHGVPLFFFHNSFWYWPVFGLDHPALCAALVPGALRHLFSGPLGTVPRTWNHLLILVWLMVLFWLAVSLFRSILAFSRRILHQTRNTSGVENFSAEENLSSKSSENRG